MGGHHSHGRSSEDAHHMLDNDEEYPLTSPPPRSHGVFSKAPRSRSKILYMIPTIAFAVSMLVIFKPVELRTASQWSVGWGSAVAEPSPGGEVVGVEVKEENGVEQRPIEWRGRDLELRKYKWGEHKPHESLERVLQTLDQEERRTREWVLDSRIGPSIATGVGLGRSEPPQRIWNGPSNPPHTSPPNEGEGPGIFRNGSKEKYDVLLQEWRTGRRASSCKKGGWEDAYTKLHDDMVKGRTAPKLIQYRCKAGLSCGGLADRMLGITSAFLLSIVTKRAISISWEHPVPFDLLFDSPRVDWSVPYPNSTSTPHPIYDDVALQEKARDIEFLNWRPARLDGFLGNISKVWGGYEEPYIRMVSNRGIILRSFDWPDTAPILAEAGLEKETAYACIVDYFLRPKPEVLAFIGFYTSLFSLPSIYSITIQVRTGDKSMLNEAYDLENTVETHSAYFTCAAQVAEAYAQPGQKIVYYLLSDSETLKRDALAQFPERVVISGLGARHAELSEGHEVVTAEADMYMDSIAESWMIAGTDFQILSASSGFGKIPTLMRAKPGSTIRVPNTSRDGPKHRLPHCGTKKALTTYDQLAASWSLA